MVDQDSANPGGVDDKIHANVPGNFVPQADTVTEPAPSKRRRRSWLVLPLLAAAVLAGIYSFNYIQLQNPMNEVLKGDSRNTGVEVRVHYGNYVNPSVLIYDLRSVSGTNSKIDVFRSFLQFADKIKDKRFDRIELCFRSNTRFTLDGGYFQTLGRDYGTQNPVWTMNHFPENLYLPDGSKAYSTWTGGWLGVAGKQIEDFNDVHDKWYLRELLQENH